ncbi:sensor domain-containing protein [Parafrankia elaeagni]|uniref:sensor domain-containing protein n=1 Tax=Parafrankia elaeagni TaxID=222534 RepID=UPI0012B65F10|nr:sensor domain-containing protein [Parafrankia elaeagni]
MMGRRRPWCRSLLLAVLALLVSAVAGACAQGPDGPARATGGDVAGLGAGATPVSVLRSGLLQLADVPAGFRRSEPSDPTDAVSEPPACARTLNELELDRPADPRASQARAFFVQDDITGPWIQQVLRAYPPGGARQRFHEVVDTLTSCTRFTITTAQPPAEETVTARTPPGLGSESWAATVTYDDGVLSIHNQFVIVRVDDYLVVLTVAAGQRPSDQAVDALARAAAARLVTMVEARGTSATARPA